MNRQLKMRWYDIVFCTIFSFFLLVANGFMQSKSMINKVPKDFFFWIKGILLSICVIGAFFVCKSLFLWVIAWLEKRKVEDCWLIKCFSRHPFWTSFCLLLFAWLPYAWIRFPAVSEWDAYHQLIQGLEYQPINYNWPLASTLFFTRVYQVGMALFHTPNSAIFFLVVVQTVLCAACFSYSMVVVNRMKIHPLLKLVVLLIYAVATIYPRYMTAIVKDALFASVVVAYVAILMNIFLLQQTKKSNYVGLLLVAFFMSILRNNGIYLVAFSFVGTGIAWIKERKKENIILMVILLFSIFLYRGYHGILGKNGVPKGTIAEALSIPFQQTARYLIVHSGEVTMEERETIQKVLQVDTIVKQYNPRLSDYVKGTYHGETKDLIAYFKVWWQQFWKHPMTYVDATFHNSFEYFYPGAREEESGLYRTTNNDEKVKLFDETQRHPTAMKYLTGYIEMFETFPLTGIFCDTGIHFWITLYLALYAICERKTKLLYCLLPSLVGILVCIAGPTYMWNGIRYALPVIYVTPLLLMTFRHASGLQNVQSHRKIAS